MPEKKNFVVFNDFLPNGSNLLDIAIYYLLIY